MPRRGSPVQGVVFLAEEGYFSSQHVSRGSKVTTISLLTWLVWIKWALWLQLPSAPWLSLSLVIICSGLVLYASKSHNETMSMAALMLPHQFRGCKIPVTFSKFPGFPEIPVERFSKSGGKSQEMYRKYTTVVVALPLLPTNHFTHTSVAPLQTYPSLAWLLTFLSEEIPYCFVLGFDLL